MMQHAPRLDQVEALLERAEPHDVGLRIRDVLESKRARLRHRVGEARAAEIDREHPRTLELLRGQDRVLAGAATRDENVEAAGFAEGAERRVRKSLAQIGIDAGV